MNKSMVIMGAILLFVSWQVLTLADSIETSISVLGSTSLSTSVQAPEKMYSNSMFTADRANVTRDLSVEKDISSSVRVLSTGVIGMDEYEAEHRGGKTPDIGCVFEESIEQSGVKHDTIESSGLFQSGVYASEKKMANESTRSRTMINGTGMVNLKTSTEGINTSQNSRTHASGQMQLDEAVHFGEEDER